MQCPDCGAEMVACEAPAVGRSFRLGRFEIQFMVWGVELFCVDCVTAREQQRDDDLFEAGAEHGYREARAKFEEDDRV